MRMHAKPENLVRAVLTTLLLSLAAASVAAQELPYRTQAYHAGESRTVVVPGDQPAGGSVALESMGELLAGYPGTFAKRSDYEAMLANLPGNQTLSDVRPKTGPYVEVDDVSIEDAAWLKIRFRKFDLGDSRLIISSPDTGNQQTFTGKQLIDWSGYSTMFIGNRVRVRWLVPESDRVPVPIESLIESLYESLSE